MGMARMGCLLTIVFPVVLAHRTHRLTDVDMSSEGDGYELDAHSKQDESVQAKCPSGEAWVAHCLRCKHRKYCVNCKAGYRLFYSQNGFELPEGLEHSEGPKGLLGKLAAESDDEMPTRCVSGEEYVAMMQMVISKVEEILSDKTSGGLYRKVGADLRYKRFFSTILKTGAAGLQAKLDGDITANTEDLKVVGGVLKGLLGAVDGLIPGAMATYMGDDNDKNADYLSVAMAATSDEQRWALALMQKHLQRVLQGSYLTAHSMGVAMPSLFPEVHIAPGTDPAKATSEVNLIMMQRAKVIEWLVSDSAPDLRAKYNSLEEKFSAFVVG